MGAWQVVQGLALIAIAAVGAVIARGQYRAAQVKLQLDLFDRRYRTFAALKSLFGHMVRHGDVSFEAIGEYDIDTVEADFLFGQPVVDYLKVVRDKAFDLNRAREIVRTPKHPERTEAIQTSKDVMIWLGAQYEVAKDVFRPYLRLDTHLVDPNQRWWQVWR